MEKSVKHDKTSVKQQELNEARFHAPASTDCQTLMVGDLLQWRQTFRRRKKPHKTKPETEREFPVEVYTERDLREREREKEIHRTFSVANVCNITSTATEIRTTTRHEDSNDATTAVDPVQEQEQEERSLTRFQNVVSKPLAQAFFFFCHQQFPEAMSILKRPSVDRSSRSQYL